MEYDEDKQLLSLESPVLNGSVTFADVTCTYATAYINQS